MIISDLNHLETIAEDPKVVGGSHYYPPYYNHYGHTGSINVHTNIIGNVATVKANAEAYGDNTFSNINAYTIATDNSSHSSVSGTSASSSH
ncbi:hypothetical protein [Moorena sp. SIO4G3]|uniref:hypothetical protein n=1 Tax=Moorena sp. SIO4G3 TaxID=2607821 RepID=UPI00142B8297|nr:hypothetical protein [Moorena sp. SIO4G3]NEO78899.1 hypothetical protein [Moorena sp. SIO4G3]